MKADMKIVDMIGDFSTAPGPSGFEDEVLLVARKYLDPSYVIEEDSMRNLYIYPGKMDESKPTMMLDAHSDEVGFMVHSIHENGTLRMVMLGGWNISSLPSNRVLVRNAEGEYIAGIFAAKPVHFMSAAEKAGQGQVAMKDLIVDIGARSKEEAVNDFHIRIGEPAIPDVEFLYDEDHDLIFGKAFDCRIGCAALIETLNRLKDEDLDVNVVGVLSSQEEVGERGAMVSVNHVKPDIAFCFEGCPADDTFTESYAIQTALKKGPMFRHVDVSVICNPRYQRHVLSLADEKGIPVQESVREGGGNNGAVIQRALGGIPVVVAGVPVRYIHTQSGITSYEDFENTVNIAVETVKSINRQVIETF